MVQARTVLWYVVFCGFAVNYMIRININIAMVSMVRSSQTYKKTTQSLDCYTVNRSVEETYTNSTKVIPIHGEFEWDEKTQNLILGAFFWFHWLLQIPGGIITRHYGTKAVFGLSNLVAILLTFAVPVTAHIDYRLLVLLRVIQGLVVGMAWPSMQHLTAHWIPPNERSRFVSAYLGSSIGVAVTYPLCGMILDLFKWETVFYVTGFIGLVWFIVWWLIVFDTPEEHPRISEKERQYIQKSLGTSVTSNNIKVPWKAMLTSIPVLIVNVAQCGAGYGLFTLMTQAPTYFDVILGWNIKMVGIWSGLPHLCRCFFAIGFGMFADYLITNKTMSRTNVRKFAVFICNILQGVLILGIAYSGCNSTEAILFLITATGVAGATSSGMLSNVVDLSPNFASILQGLTGVTGNIPGFVSSYIVGILTYQNQTLEQWKKVYLITAVMLISTGSLYLCFGNSNLQEWNSGHTSIKDQDSLRPINNETQDIKMNDIKIVQKTDKTSGVIRK